MSRDVVIQKFGGTSVSDPSRLRRVAGLAARSHADAPTVVVVSAQGNTTDELLRQAGAIGEPVASRETDQLLATGELASAALLAMHVRALGVPAISLSGPQAGIEVAGPPGEGRIAAVRTARILGLLAEGTLVVVAGFQGAGANGDVVTLGRGGSDTTAVALAAALGARCCEIFTDVDGVFSADPRVVTTARLRPAVGVDVMVELAFAGARVLHSRAVELAAARHIDLHVQSSFRSRPGTLITRGGDEPMTESLGIVAIAHDLDVARVLVRSDRGGRDPAVDVLGVFAHQHAPVDLVARSGPFEPEFRMGLTMRRSDLPRVLPELSEVVESARGALVVDDDVAKVSLVGTGLLNRPQYTAQLLNVLSEAGIATSWVSTSQLRSSVIVPAGRALEAVSLLHDSFLAPERAAGDDPFEPAAGAGSLVPV